MEIVNENTLHVTEYELLEKLPDLFRMENGKRVRTREDWEVRRKELFRVAVELQYGTQPPAPEFLDVETLYESPLHNTYKIHTGTKEHPVSFRMKVILPRAAVSRPVIVDGDLCFGYAMEGDFLAAALDENVGWVFFDRTELAHDLPGEGRRKGALYDVYPEETFGALGAWAWGYSRCVDALEKLALPGIDLSAIAFSGHSRGGKTAMLAGVLDTRAAVVNPNETCAGSCGCYRIHMRGYSDGETEKRSERLSDLWKNFGYWLGPEMGRYAEDETALPFDCHFLKALVAPRVLFVSEAAGDIWANPVGSWQTTMAAREAYRFLGAEENLYWYFRPGTHFHEARDVKMLVNILLHRHDGKPLSEDFGVLPFTPPEFAF